MTSEPFLSRWSKRKQAARGAGQAPDNAASSEPEPPAFDAAPEPAAAEQGSGSATPTEAELSPEEVAELPSLEELTADTDISVFLRKSVPALLSNAALRRMWSLDPKIRDFVGDARDYAYDWNTPGGVPGYGPLPSTEEVARMAARIVGGDASAPPGHEVEAENAASAPSKDREQHSNGEAGAIHADGGAPHQNPALLDKSEVTCEAADAGNVIAPPSSAETFEDRQPASGTQVPRTDEPAKSPSGPRHGGAMPL